MRFHGDVIHGCSNDFPLEIIMAAGSWILLVDYAWWSHEYALALDGQSWLMAGETRAPMGPLAVLSHQP